MTEVMTRVCPECGRSLTLRVNRFGVELWPVHNYARIGGVPAAELNRVMAENRGREPGHHDWEVRCVLSGTPVEA